MAETCSTVTLSRGGSVTMAIDAPDVVNPGRTPVLVLAHGAGNDMRSAFLEHFAAALASRGVTVVRFNFPYKERTGQRPPDRMDVLVDTFHDVVLAQSKRTGSPPGPLFLGGKSMGGRAAAALVAAERVRPSGLVFLGFPLHKAGAKETLRTDDLPRVKRPMLFIQGTRDPLCDIELLRRVRKEMKLPGTLHTIEGGDHSFALLKSQQSRQAAELSAAADAIVEFAQNVLAKPASKSDIRK
ncbi:MAG: alpha/beta fold hydrolase [Planctomycetes bacterium]|nr:alpha/beta fold hydrolase [Planctomycetota bacterium]